MKNKELIKQLENLDIPDIEMPRHKHVLRSALLASSQFKKSARKSFFGTDGYFLPITDLITFITMPQKRLAFGGIFVVLALVAVFGFGNFITINTAYAKAQELVNKSYAVAVKLTPEVRAQIEAQMKADMLQTLKEAKAASDLRVLTKEEYEKDAQFTISPRSVNLAAQPSGGKDVVVNIDTGTAGVRVTNSEENVMWKVSSGTTGVASMGTIVNAEAFSEPVTYLKYTDPVGRKTVLGLDKNDTPVFKFSELKENDIIHYPDGTIGIQGQVMKKIEVSQ